MDFREILHQTPLCTYFQAGSREEEQFPCPRPGQQTKECPGTEGHGFPFMPPLSVLIFSCSEQ